MALIKKPTACLIDLDGTLVRHKNKRLIANLERFDTLIHILSKPFKRSSTIATEMDLTVNVESNPLIHRIIHGIRKIRGITVDQVVEPEAGAEDFLKALRGKEILIGLSSNAYGRSYGKYVLRHYNLRDYFDALIFRENVRHGKPEPEPILRTLYQLGLDENKPQLIWFIGDQAKDMKAVFAAQQQLPEAWEIIPIAFGGASSTAHMYLSSVREELDSVTSQNFIRSFVQLKNRLKKL